MQQTVLEEIVEPYTTQCEASHARFVFFFLTSRCSIMELGHLPFFFFFWLYESERSACGAWKCTMI